MTVNPFIRLAQDPVGFFTGLAFGLAMLGILAVALPWSVRQSATLWVDYLQNRHTNAWWAFGDRTNGYFPPLPWLVKAFVVIMVLATAAFAVGALAWLVGV